MTESPLETATESGPPGRARRALLSLLAEQGIRPEHPAEVEAEAAALVAAPGLDDPALEDRTALPLVTIDEPHSKDLDQAVEIAREGEGYVVRYALADASYYVRPGGALYAEALRRGSSYYLPGVVAPMLPRSLSEGIISLGPRVDRRALLFEVSLDGAGRVLETRVSRARVHSRAKLSYGGVQRWLDGQGELGCDDPAVAESLRLLEEVGRLRMQLADDRGVTRFRRTEVSLALEGARGMRFVAFTDPRGDVERFNEQISLLVNAEGARLLARPSAPGLVQPIYRVHGAPPRQHLQQLQRQIDALVEAGGLAPEIWRWDLASEGLAAYLARLPRGGPAARIARAIHRQAVVSSGSARFSADPGPHHGVGAALYARFTAPMREVIGVFLHDELLEQGRGAPSPVPAGFPDDEALRREVIEASSRARELQRKLDKIANRMVLDQIFSDDLRGGRPARVGTVMGISRSKVHVQLDEPGIDVKIYLAHLREQLDPRARVSSDRASLLLAGAALRVGDPVRVSVVRRDEERDRWELTLERFGAGETPPELPGT